MVYMQIKSKQGSDTLVLSTGYWRWLMTVPFIIAARLKPSSTASQMGQKSYRFRERCVNVVFLIIIRNNNVLKFINDNREIRQQVRMKGCKGIICMLNDHFDLNVVFHVLEENVAYVYWETRALATENNMNLYLKIILNQLHYVLYFIHVRTLMHHIFSDINLSLHAHDTMAGIEI